MNDNEDKLKEIRDELKEIDDIELASSSRHNIEITRKGVSKGRAVEVLGSYYNIKREEIVAIGDSENDLTMIEYAGLGIAMGNAIDVVKVKADYITDTNNNDGVVKAINKFIVNNHCY
jgi:Cof subfamily protein (haloacid dehalogenase superfamily)